MMSVRTVWITSNYPCEADPVAGIFFRTQARALARAGVDVEVVAPVPFVPAPMARLAERWDRYRRTPREQMDEGVTVRRPRYLATVRQNEVGVPHLFLGRAARSVLRGAHHDVVHGHYAYPEGVAALGLARGLGLPFVLTLHGDDGNTYPDLGPTARRRFERAVSGADAVVAVSQALADATERRTGVRPEVLPVGLDLRGFANLPSKEQARAKLGIAQEEFVVLFVGYLLETKGIRELLTAMQSPGLTDAAVWFVGDGPLRRLAADTPGARLVGAVPNEKVHIFMRAADVLALPSYGEGTPTVVVEAGAADLPVVATSVGGTVALLGEGRGLLVPPQLAGTLAEALLEVRDRPAAARQRAEKLKSYVAALHDADYSARRLRDIYLRLSSRTTTTTAGTKSMAL